MSEETEIELRYLLKRLPKGLDKCESKEVFDIYIPESGRHPKLRIRKSGGRFMITKKRLNDPGNNPSSATEQTIPLTEDEFKDLSGLPGKRLRKIRYMYDYGGKIVEIGVYKDGLQGLVMADIEFDNIKDKDSIKMPDFCLADVTGVEFLAAGMLCGKRYSDIEGDLQKYGYRKIIANE